MPGEDIQSWSTVAADNGTADTSIDWHEGQARRSVNNSARSEMAAHAKHRNLNNGSIVTTGSANAQAFLSGVGYTTIPTGLRATLKVGPGLTNDTLITLNMDGIGNVAVKTASGENLLGGEFVENGYVDLIYDGTNWIFLYGREFFFDMMTGGGGVIIGHQIFDDVGTFTYTPTPTMECCIIECVAGGGAGGGATASVDTTYVGGGGGGGGYSRKVALAADIGASISVTIGGGGAGVSTGNGGDGSDTFVGTSYAGALCGAKGGSGGKYGTGGVSSVNGGAGGAVGIGDIVAGGNGGGAGGYNAPTAFGGGMGGPGPFGGGGHGVHTTAVTAITGANATNYGGGGSGGYSTMAASAAGGNGSSGVIIITEFAGRGTPGRDGETGPVGPVGPAGPGTGDVLVSGTPAAGQYARWIDTSHIQGITPPFPSITGTPTAGQTAIFTNATTVQGVTKAGFRAHKNGTDQTGIPSATYTKLTFGTEVFDQGSLYDTTTSRWTPPAGLVHVSGSAILSNLSGASAQSLAVYKNGTVLCLGQNITAGGISITAVRVDVVDNANGTDYYELWVSVTTGATGVVSGTATSSYFQGHAA